MDSSGRSLCLLRSVSLMYGFISLVLLSVLKYYKPCVLHSAYIVMHCLSVKVLVCVGRCTYTTPVHSHELPCVKVLVCVGRCTYTTPVHSHELPCVKVLVCVGRCTYTTPVHSRKLESDFKKHQ